VTTQRVSDLIGLNIGVMPSSLIYFHSESYYLAHTESRTSRPTGGEFPMRTMLLTAAAVLALGVGAANAQGIGATATAPGYGQKWAEIQRTKHLNASTHTTTPNGKATARTTVRSAA
jgi:hypothetical protein